MADYELLCEDSKAIWILRINRPPANTLTSKLIDQLFRIVKEFKTRRESKVLILTGVGNRFFIGGAELSEIMSIRSPSEAYQLAKKGQELCNAIEALLKPTIAAINGSCIGGGNELALACHIRIATENAMFQQPEVALGIMPAFGATQRLPKLIGEGRARKMLLTCEKLNAREALGCGLIDEIAEEGNGLERALEIARAISSKSQVAVRLTQQAIKQTIIKNSKEGLLFELQSFQKLWSHEEVKEALAAFRERREPLFRKHTTKVP